MKRHAIWFAAALAVMLAATGCGSMEYKDSTGAVDANPLCVSSPDQPHQPVSEDCSREQGGSWSSERKSEPVDFGKDDD